MEITAAQIRAARGLLNWSVPMLAEHAEVSIRSVQRLEAGHGAELRPPTRKAIIGALEGAGVEFVEAHGKVGVIL